MRCVRRTLSARSTRFAFGRFGYAARSRKEDKHPPWSGAAARDPFKSLRPAHFDRPVVLLLTTCRIDDVAPDNRPPIDINRRWEARRTRCRR